MKKLTTFLLLTLFVLTMQAQRVIDNLDRGVVAVKTTGGVFVSWRIQSDEYYDVTYNLYRDGSLIAENLKVSNFTDASGSTSSKYTVAAVVNGVVQKQSQPVAVWAQDYMEITPKHPEELKATYVPNDACAADVDGDGEVELLMKYNNSQEMSNSFPVNGWFKEHTLFEVTKLDGSVLWWVNCGPNMGDFQNNEQNIVGYDWDQDGSAEVLMRLEEGSSIHMFDGSVYTIGADGKNGTSWTNYRSQGWVSPAGATAAIETGLSSAATASCPADWVTLSIVDGVVYATAVKNGDPKENPNVTTTARSTTITVVDNGVTKKFGFGQNYYRDGKEISGQYFTHYGKEFLVYCNGETGQIYDIIDFPCARFESGESDLNAAWGDGYGHRSSKFFYGAPYLDGRNPSIFIGRGIYTRHKFVALNVDKNTHKLSERWRWMNNQKGSPWYGQGYHNYGIADVDWDGRDEIVFGGLVIDDNGMGLSTAGFGHGDAQHHGDFNPYIHGHEGWFCNEEQPSNHYRDLTTAKLYYRLAGGSDDGRAIAGNFCNTVPGAFASSSRDSDNPISLVTNEHVAGYDTNGMAQNFNCYWDGDLCEETYNADGTNYDNKPGAIYKYGRGKIKTFEGSLANNWTKATPCFMGDILGDWRHEFVMRTADNKIRIYTTTIETPWRVYSMWYDHQQRNAMVWQMCGYNQPPHTSYFLGEMEGITAAPPALTMKGRTEVKNNGTISNNGESVITCETNDMTVNVADGATPYIYIDNAPSLVSGSAPSEATAKEYPITYKYYTHTLTDGAFAGDMRLVKQGDGALTLPDVVQTYTGQTDVWAGTLNFNGTLQNSRLWLNRFAELNSDNGTFAKGIQAEYAAIIRPGGKEAKASTITTDSLILDFGSVVELDIYSNGLKADSIKANVLKIEKKDWTNGPQYLAPVFRINAHPATDATEIADGIYCLGTIGEVKGNLGDIIIENLPGARTVLSHEDGKLYLEITNYSAKDLVWIGDESSVWENDGAENFKTADEGEKSKFYHGSEVTFNNDAVKTSVEINGPVSVKALNFEGTKSFTLSGDSIVGNPDVYKTGTGSITLNNVNHTGNTTIEGGYIFAGSLANEIGTEYGSLGSVDKSITLVNNGKLGVNSTMTSGQTIYVAEGNGTLNVGSNATFSQSADIISIGGDALYKTGAGTLNMPRRFGVDKLVISSGNVNGVDDTFSDDVTQPKTVEIRNATYTDTNSEGSSSINPINWLVPSGYTATLIIDPRCNYTGKLSGAGTFVVTASGVRSYLQGDWSGFEGEIDARTTKRGSYNPIFCWDNNYGLPKAVLNVGSGYTFNTNGKNINLLAFKDDATGTITGGGTITVGAGYDANISCANVLGTAVVYAGEPDRQIIFTNANCENVKANFTVQSGTLYIQGTSRVANRLTFNPSYITTVTGSGMMCGPYMKFGNVAVSNGGVLSITGANDTWTTATATSILNIRSGGVLDMKITSNTQCSKLNSSSTLTFWSGSKLKVRLADGVTLAKGNTFTLWDVATISGNDTKCTVELPELPDGLIWDKSGLWNTTGVITVIEDPTFIYENLADDVELTADVYSLDGIAYGRIVTTKAGVHESVRKLVSQQGNYVVKFSKGTITDNIIVSVK